MPVEKADLEWRDGEPFAARFGDSYFSAQGGLEEARAVFLAGCGLPDAWAGRTLFRVGELGFGTGLNILALWDLWRRHRPPDGRLCAVSVEAYPLSAEDAARAHARFPELAALSARLRAQWPAAFGGAHYLSFPEDGFSLTVAHGPVPEVLEEIEGRFDAWFLDGFAPARNPQMWTPEVMARVAALSAPGARAATFTVAGAVRRALAEAGFAVDKRPGFGRKRERLEAVRQPGPPAACAAADPLARGRAVEGEVLVLGGGIAGCAAAAALAARGRAVRIVSHGPAASTPPCALLTPRLENADRPHARALYAAFLYAARRYRALPGALAADGGVRLPKAPGDDGEAARLAAIAGLWPGLDWTDGRLAMPRAGVLDPPAVLTGLAGDIPRIDASAARAAYEDGRWTLFDAAGGEIASAPVLVLAGGAGMAGLDLAAPLGLRLSAGQVSLHRAARPPETLAAWGGFAAPAGAEQVMVGATHDAADSAAPPPADPARTRALAGDVARRLPDAGLEPEPERIWAGVRAAPADRLPCAGPVPDPDAYRAAFAELARGRAAEAGEAGEAGAAFPPGLFALTGLGSRGFAHAPLLAEALAAEICGEPGVLEASARRAFHPARFLWRDLKRG